jgi:hypothetical protein
LIKPTKSLGQLHRDGKRKTQNLNPPRRLSNLSSSNSPLGATDSLNKVK